MQRDSFIFYRSFYEGIKELPRDIQGEVLTAIMEYSLNGETTENLKPVAKAIFTLVKPQIDSNNQRFENGKKGGRPTKKKTEQKPNDNQTKTKPIPNVNDNVYVNVNDNVDDDVLIDVDELKKKYIKNEKLVNAFCDNNGISKNELFDGLEKFTKNLKDKNRFLEKEKEYVTYFKNWFVKKEKSSAKKESKTAAQAFKERIYGSSTN
ncbi:DUF6291 domain-containing protein [Joostella sp. CR20]|uniref:DUF6291 domain-containing protein n=1 Tax=Joostella sp. CR20 TaxID=2804312 RepID=UPI00313DCF7B